MNNRHMSLMLLATLKIVSCLKNYCCHNDDNTHIVNLLHLSQSLQKRVSCEFEYHLQLEFDIFLELTINYKYPNSPIVCAVLALDSWNYCSGEQAQQPNIHKICQSSLYS